MSRQGPSRSIITRDIHGAPLFSEAQYIANAADVGSMGRGIAASGFTVSGDYVEMIAGLTLRKVIALNNQGADTVFVGPSGNGIANMFPIAGSGGAISFNITSGIQIFAITDGTSTNIRVIEIG